MSEITIFLLYLLAAVAFVLERQPQHQARSSLLITVGCAFGGIGLLLHALLLGHEIFVEDGLLLTIAATVSLVGLQMALTGLLGALDVKLRGMAATLLLLAGISAITTLFASDGGQGTALSWQMQAHVLISMFAYGLLTVGAIVAVFSLIQDRRLRSGNWSPGNQLFAPLETTEKLLFGIAATGFAALLLSVLSGILFVDNLFGQHLVHKTSLSILALTLFGILVAGRQFAGWRGKRAVYLYLWGFAILGLAYFGSRYVLEEILGRSWG